MKLKRVGLDLAKRVFQVHGVDASEQAVVRKTLTRKRLRAFFAQLEPTLGKTDRRSTWINALVQRRNRNIATVAVANKNARIIWAMLTRGEDYRPAV